MPTGYTWFVRVTFLGFCVVSAWALYTGLVLGKLSVRCLTGQDVLAILALTFGIYATTQIIFRYISVPNPRITIADRLPNRLGPKEAQTVPPEASDEVKRNVKRNNQLRQFAAHHIEVWSLDLPWFLRPLIQKVAVDGCQIRFRYTRIYDGGEEPMLNGEWLFGRWHDNPQPITHAGFEPGAAFVNRRLAKLFPTEKKGHIDGYPFAVAFAMKKQGMKEFYHFNDESYRWPAWCNRQWLLGIGTYRLQIRLTGHGLLRATTETLKLTNKGTNLDDLILEEWQ